MASTVDLKEVLPTNAIAEFAIKFCNELDTTKSVVSSPLSVEILLSLLALGSTDPAHSELLKSLSMPDDDRIRKSFKTLTEEVKLAGGITLNLANKIYMNEGPFEIMKEFENDAVNIFNASIEKVDFNNNVAAAELINEWVMKATNDRIKDLLTSDSICNDTRLILVNALYFKGNWKKQFDPINTIDMTFHLNLKSTVEIPMMYKEDRFLFGECNELDAKFLEMPYDGDQASMLIVLPNQIDGLSSILQKLAGGYDLIAVTKKMYSTTVQVTLPKFKIETEIDLKSLLPKLGIKAIFDESNSGLTKLLNNGEKLFVSKAIQKAFIEVNEEGSEAAAATVMVVRKKRCVHEPPRRFTASWPALWCVLVGDSRTVAFIATYKPQIAHHALSRDDL